MEINNRSSNSMHTLREYRKKHNLCIGCGNLKDRIGYYCKKCRNYHTEKTTIYTRNLFKDRKCTSCSQPMDRQGWFCIKCCNKLRIKNKQKAQERRLAGLCVQCGKKVEHYVYCQTCRDSRMAKYWAKKNQG